MYKKSIQSIREAIDFVGRKEQELVLDALACMFHNEGYFLQGNSEQNDDLWLARHMWNQYNDYQDFDRQPAETRTEFIKFSRLALKALPAICERIADRYIAASKAIRSIEKELKAANNGMNSDQKQRDLNLC